MKQAVQQAAFGLALGAASRRAHRRVRPNVISNLHYPRVRRGQAEERGATGTFHDLGVGLTYRRAASLCLHETDTASSRYHGFQVRITAALV
jgi:hypothetical protein